MNVTEQTPRKEATIAGVNVEIPQPVAEGQTLTAGMAAALNQLLVENVRNNLAGRAKPKKDADGNEVPGVAITQALVDEYVAGYEFGVSRRGSGGGRPAVDPVRKEALALAIAAVKQAVVNKGLKVADYGMDNIRAKAEELVENRPTYTEQARKIIAQREKTVSDAIEI